MANETAAATPSPAAAPAIAPSPTPSAAPASTPSAPKSATDALKGAEARLSGAPASPAGPTSDQGVNDGKPPAGALTPSVDGQKPASPAGEGGIAQLRSAYEGLKAQSQALAWAKDISPDEARTAMELLQELRSDPVAFYRQLNQDIAQHPEYSKAVQPPTPDDAEPKADLVTTGPDGQKIRVYSEEQQQKWRDWNNSRQMRIIDEKLNPLNEFHRTQQAQARERQIVDSARTHTTEVMAEMRKMPHFAGPDNEEKIAAKLRAIPPQVKRKVGAVAALNMAYNQHLRDNILPTINSTAEQRVREDMARRANAGAGTVTPGGGNQPRGVAAPKNVNDLSAHLRKLAAGT